MLPFFTQRLLLRILTMILFLFVRLPTPSSLMTGLKTMQNKRRRGMTGGSSSGTNPVSSRSRHNAQGVRTNTGVRTNIERLSTTRSGARMKRVEKDWKPKPVRSEDNQTPTPPKEKQVQRGNSLAACSLARKGEHGSSDEFTAKRTILGWLVDTGTVQVDARVLYMNMACTRPLLEGRLSKDGIFCNCCRRIVTVSAFELHAGSKLGDPYRNIFLETGINLLKCQVNAWEKLGDAVRRGFNEVDCHAKDNDKNDDTCGICGDGGNLICCDNCPSTFHTVCLGMQILPQGDWRCHNCRCIDCGSPNSPRAPLLSCRQCEKKYHQGCLNEDPGRIIDAQGVFFCGQICKKVFERLQSLIGAKKDLGSGYSCVLNQRLDHVPVKTLFRQTTRVTSNAKLAVTLVVMEECFDPILDAHTQVDMIRGVIFNCGSNLNRLNYMGFYTVTLEKGDDVISAASIRIHGTKLAEMPFIATRNIYRCQGMCSRLLLSIELMLRFLGVEKLLIPSIHERVDKWQRSYHFRPVDRALKQDMRSMNLLRFPETVLLQKTPMVGYAEARNT